MTYVDGFVIPILKKNMKEYKKQAQWGKKMWMKHGALQYFECVGDDLKGMPGCATFKQVAKLKANQTVFFSFIIFKSKAHRVAVNRKVIAEMHVLMKGKKMKEMSMPFDPKRMAYGGFKTVVQG